MSNDLVYCNAAGQKRIAELVDECEALKHDLGRLMARETEHVNRIAELEAALGKGDAP